MRLLIATPAFDPLVWAQSYAAVVSMDKCGMEVDCLSIVGFSVKEARTKAAKSAVDKGYDWLLCIDSDVVPPKDALENALSHGKDVVFGYYAKGKNTEGKTCLYEAGRKKYDVLHYKQELQEMRDAGDYLIPVRGGGFGFVLINPSVFKRLKEPWFDYVWDYDGRKLSEDYYFCTECRKAGIGLFADTRIDCGHVKECVI